jgi:hypothetical protein
MALEKAEKSVILFKIAQMAVEKADNWWYFFNMTQMAIRSGRKELLLKIKKNWVRKIEKSVILLKMT